MAKNTKLDDMAAERVDIDGGCWAVLVPDERCWAHRVYSKVVGCLDCFHSWENIGLMDGGGGFLRLFLYIGP